jgi:alpha-L-rhamnosidase
MTAAAPRYLRCEGHVDPLGIDALEPRLTWEVDDQRRGARPTAYEIVAASSEEALAEGRGDLWESGRVESGECGQVVWAGAPLTSRARCWWKVRTWDREGAPSPWSALARFEVGLVGTRDGWRFEWTGQWIRAPLRGDRFSGAPAPYLRRRFTLDGPVVRARLYVTALGLHETYVNGRVVSPDVYRPGWTDYRIRVPYQVYDVTGLLRTGENVVGAILGDGWYCGRNAISGGSRQAYGERPALLAQVEVHLHGARDPVVVATDGQWTWSEGPILASDNFAGESYDARRELHGWSEPGFDASRWGDVDVLPLSPVALVATVAPPVRRIEEIAPVRVTEPSPGVRVFDLGQNFAGRVRLRVAASRGTQIQLRHAEGLESDGSIWRGSLANATATDAYVCSGAGEETWEPRFTFHGFRYVEVTADPVLPDSATVTGIVLHSDMPRTGEFACSHPGLTKLHENTVWSQRGNSLDVPTDCPQRDERLGWTGDVVSFARTAAFHFDVSAFLSKWMTDLLDAQIPSGVEEGQFPVTAPRGTAWGGGPAWSDAGIEVPWTLWEVYGDRRILDRCWPALERWMAFLDRQEAGRAPGAWKGFGDWVSLDFDPAHPLGFDERWGGTPLDLLRRAFHVRAADRMSRIAGVLGRTDAARAWRARFEELRARFVAAHVADGRLATPTQTACALAIEFDLLADPALRAAVAADLAADVERRGHLVTGFVGTPHLLHALESAGRADLAWRLLEREEIPSWLFEVRHGATTTWERWDAWTPERGYRDGMNSLNHYALGAVGHWMHRAIGGIDVDPSGPGYRRVRVAPRPGGSVTWARASFRSPLGLVATSWRLDDGRFHLECTIPPGAVATVRLPARDPADVTESGRPLGASPCVGPASVRDGTVWCEVESGSYAFDVANARL